MTVPRSPYLSIVLTGRNDDFGGNFAGRLFGALQYNHARLEAAGLAYELVFVEWRPVPGKPLLSDELRRQLPEINERLTTIEVDARYHSAFTQNPRLQFHEFIAKNVGIRRAAGAHVLATNSDVYLSGKIVSWLAEESLQPRTLYRATRVDLKSGLDQHYLAEDAFADERNYEAVNTMKSPFFTNGAGDFLLLEAGAWAELRGFNEVFRAAKIHIDANFCYQAAAAGMAIVDTGARIFHVGAGTFHRQRGVHALLPHTAPWGSRWHKRVLYDNPPDWGLARAPITKRDSRHWRLEFSEESVPPLVSLGGIRTGKAQRLTP